jgi:hypothetical protein
MPEPIVALRLDGPPLHVDLPPGGEIVLRGSYRSSFDGTVIDAATTTWPADAPGGASIDPSGLVNLEAGGFHLVSRDAKTHEVHAIVTGKGGEACAAQGSAAPCLPLRLSELGLERRPVGIPRAELARSLQGGIRVEGLPPPVVPPAATPYLAFAGGALALGLAAAVAVRLMTRRAASPARQLVLLARRVRDKLDHADVVLAAPLRPAVDAALRSLQERRVRATSTEGARVRAVLLRVDARLDASRERAAADEEERAADELLREIDSAIEAADELTLHGDPTTSRR